MSLPNPSPTSPGPTLGELQQKFVHMIGQLIIWTYTQPGYSLSFGEAYRTLEQAALDAQKGIGIRNSLHTVKLAVDLNLFVDGVFQSNLPAYEPMGVYWESLGGSWGGRFSSPDADHFSLAFAGLK